MAVHSMVLADVPFPPSVEDFYLPSILPWGEHNNYWFTKITALVWLSAALIIIFFLVSYRKPQLVPSKKQWLAESLYGFVRNNIAIEMIGPAGVKFAPYLATHIATAPGDAVSGAVDFNLPPALKTPAANSVYSGGYVQPVGG